MKDKMQKNRTALSRTERRKQLFIAVSVLCLIGFGGTLLAEAIAKQESGWIPVQGFVLSREAEDYWDVILEINSQRYRYQVEFTTLEGQSITAEITTETPYADQGASVYIRYNPEDPASITFSEAQTPQDVALLTTVRYVLLALGLLCGILGFRYRKEKAID